MKQFIALTILTFPKYLSRARMLSVWVQIASELRDKLHNMYGCAAVMAALKLKQVSMRNSVRATVILCKRREIFIFVARIISENAQKI